MRLTGKTSNPGNNTSTATSAEQIPYGRTSGPGRLLIAVYGIFALSATARASFQIATAFDEAPLAYSLSAFAAVVYIVATISLAKPGATWAKVATIAICIELIGVLVVGALSFLDPADFEHASVWSKFGQGYGYIPLLLPIIGLIWLYRNREVK